MKPKILIFSLSYFPYIGGAEVAIKEITNRISEFEFDLITNRFDPKLPKNEKLGNVNVYRVGRGYKWEKYFYPWLAFSKAVELQNKNNYEIAWSMMATWAGWAGLKFKEQFSKVKYLLTLQSGDTDEFIKKRTWFWEGRYKQIYRKADHIQSISNFLANRAKRYGYKGTLDIVPNGVDLGKFKNQSKANNDKKIIITISRLEEKNGIEYLIKAMKKVDARLLIIGAGSLEDRLRKISKELNIENKVEFVGRVEHDELINYLLKADIFVRPSLSEGLGNAFLEAMAAGLPVVGTEVGGIPDFLKDGETGLFCKVKNPESLADKINKLIKDNELRQRLIKNGQRLVEEKYNWDNIAERMNGIFNKLIQ